jgi:hypothetical protein
MNTELFEYNGSFYTIEKDMYEPREIYMQRVWFILNKINDKIPLNELEKMSRIYVNKKILNCEYDLSTRI